MTDDASSGQGRRAETAKAMGVDPDLLDYIDDDVSVDEIRAQTEGEGPASSDEGVSEDEVAAAESLGKVVPNRISYGLYPQRAGFDGNFRPVVTWLSLPSVCTRGLWIVPILDTSIAWYERAGWCRRPQTDSYDIRWKIYWRA